MNKLMLLDEKEIANLVDWEVIQIIEKIKEGYGFYHTIKFLCLCRRIEK